MKVGQLAAKTGLTVRTLHHYDDIGLLSPSRRTPAGHRLYGEAEVRRLQQIASLRHLGLSLDEIRECLDRPEMSLDRTLEMHVQRIDDEIDRRRRLRTLIQDLRERLASNGEVSVDDLTRTIEVTVNYETYYTAGQLDELGRRRERIGEERIQQVQEEWAELFTAFGAAMDRGVDADAPEVRALARRAAALVEEFTGGDPGIQASLSTMYRTEGGEELMRQHRMPMREGLWEYMAEARAALSRPGTRPVLPESR